MIAKIRVEVKDRAEAKAITRGLQRADMRVMVMLVGTLEELPNDRARSRVLKYVADKVSEAHDTPRPVMSQAEWAKLEAGQ